MTAVGPRVFEDLLGSDAVQAVGTREPPHEGQDLPTWELAPGSVEALQATVALAREHDLPLAPLGGGTHPRSGGAPAYLIRMRGLEPAWEHAVEDLVLTVDAGMPLQEAQERLREHGQQLPLSAPYPERATLGGIVARAAEGPTLSMYGPVRDQVLGVSVVHGDGRLTRAGGRVVKNVTGYDLMRLYTGSRGAFGILTLITFRLRPLEPSRRLLYAPFEDLAGACAAGVRLRQSLPEQGGLHVLTGSRLEGLAVEQKGAALVIELRGCEPLVQALEDECRADLDGVATLLVGADDPGHDLQTPFPLTWTRVTRACERAGVERCAADLAARLETIAAPGWGAQIDLSGGLWQGGWPTHEPFAVTRFDWDPRLGDVPSDPTFHRRRAEQDPGGPASGIVERLRAAYDPAGILNRGRLES